MHFATPPKIILSHWLFFLSNILFLKLRVVLKLSNVCVIIVGDPRWGGISSEAGVSLEGGTGT